MSASRGRPALKGRGYTPTEAPRTGLGGDAGSSGCFVFSPVDRASGRSSPVPSGRGGRATPTFTLLPIDLPCALQFPLPLPSSILTTDHRHPAEPAPMSNPTRPDKPAHDLD